MKTSFSLYPFVLIGLLLTVLGCEDRPAGDPEACLNQMIALEKAQDYAAVVEKATDCLCIPGIDSSWVLKTRGFAAFRQGDFVAALQDDFRITQLVHARCIRKTSAWEGIGYLLEAKFKNYPMALWA